MSVGLAILRGGDDFDDVEVMAPDYDKEYIWLWLDDNPDIRIDLSIEQLKQLQFLLLEIL